MSTKPCRGAISSGVGVPIGRHVRTPSSIVLPRNFRSAFNAIQRGPQTVASATSVPVDPEIDDPMEMFCFQCEQTLKGEGCTKVGICGKTPDTAALQDLLIYSLKGLGAWAHHARMQGATVDPKIDSFVKGSVFATLTNVNFDESRFTDYLKTCHKYTEELRGLLKGEEPGTTDFPWFGTLPHPVHFKLEQQTGPDPTTQDLVELGKTVDLRHRRHDMHELGLDTLLGLHELLTYGLKGVAAYAHHAEMLGKTNNDVDGFCEEVLGFLGSAESNDPDKVLEYCLKLGEINLKTMQMLDEGHCSHFGDPTPTPVRITPQKGKAILVSGHDLHDLERLLQQTEGMGINVYTHGELLPAHGYPELHKYKHLAGHYGGAWYKQKREFTEFPGAILMTTNCIMMPLTTYIDRLFTTGEVGMPGVVHLDEKDFTPVINKAMELPGFTEDIAEVRTVVTGFGHRAVLNVADKVIDAVKTGDLEHIFLVGGCDAGEPSRKYYSEVVAGLSENAIVLTLGCGKFRFFDYDMGTLPRTGLPRLMDMGQCNDAYSAIVVASELAKAFDTDINSLPLSLDISWFEQKAVAVLLTLLHLGVTNIRIGPKLPAFLTSDALDILAEKFNLQVADVKHPMKDVAKMMRNE